MTYLILNMHYLRKFLYIKCKPAYDNVELISFFNLFQYLLQKINIQTSFIMKSRLYIKILPKSYIQYNTVLWRYQIFKNSMAIVQDPKNRVSFIRQLKPYKDTWRIEVRILHLWRNYNKDSRNTIEMVFVDKEVSRLLHFLQLIIVFSLLFSIQLI